MVIDEMRDEERKERREEEGGGVSYGGAGREMLYGH